MLGALTAAPLLAGAMLGVTARIPPLLLALVLAFGAGTLIASVSEELFLPGFRELGGPVAAGSLLAGTATFVLATRALDHRRGGARNTVGWALLLGVLLDGVPENAALGVGSHADAALLVAIAIGNLPEAIGGAASMREGAGLPRRRVLPLWAGLAVGLALVVPLARLGGDELGTSGIAAVQAFAGGAVLAVLADSMIPEAYENGGRNIAFAVACGFALAFAVG